MFRTRIYCNHVLLNYPIHNLISIMQTNYCTQIIDWVNKIRNLQSLSLWGIFDLIVPLFYFVIEWHSFYELWRNLNLSKFILVLNSYNKTVPGCIWIMWSCGCYKNSISNYVNCVIRLTSLKATINGCWRDVAPILFTLLILSILSSSTALATD